MQIAFKCNFDSLHLEFVEFESGSVHRRGADKNWLVKREIVIVYGTSPVIHIKTQKSEEEEKKG